TTEISTVQDDDEQPETTVTVQEARPEKAEIVIQPQDIKDEQDVLDAVKLILVEKALGGFKPSETSEDTVTKTIRKKKPKKTKDVQELPEIVETTEIITDKGKPKKRTKKVRTLVEEEGDTQKTTEIVTIEEEGEKPQTTVTIHEVPKEDIKEKPKDAVKVKELPETIEVKEIITEEGKPKRRVTKRRKIIKERDGIVETTRIETVQDDNEQPETTVTVEELKPEKVEIIIKPDDTKTPKVSDEAVTKKPRKKKPKQATVVEELPEAVEITEIITEEGKPKKRTKKVRKLVQEEGDIEKITEIVTIEEEGSAPQVTVTVHEVPIEEQIKERPKEVVRVKELPETTEVTEVLTEDGRPKRRTTKKRKIIKEKDGTIETTEIATIQDDGKQPETVVTVQEAKLEKMEVVIQPENIKDEQDVLDAVKLVLVGKALNVPKVPEVVEDQGQDVSKQIIKKKSRKPKQAVKELPEDVEVIEILTEDGRPKTRVTKRRKIVKDKGNNVQETTEIITTQDEDDLPQITVNVTEEIVPEEKKEEAPDQLIVEELPEVVEITEIITDIGKPKKRTKKVRKIVKDDGEVQQTTEIITTQDEGEQPQITVTVQEEIKELPDYTVVEEAPEVTEVSEIITDTGKKKKRTKKTRTIIKDDGDVRETTEIISVQDEGEQPQTTVTVQEETIPIKEQKRRKKKPKEAILLKEFPEVIETDEIITKEGQPKTRTTKRRKIIKEDEGKQEVTEIITVQDEGETPETTVNITVEPITETRQKVKRRGKTHLKTPTDEVSVGEFEQAQPLETFDTATQEITTTITPTTTSSTIVTEAHTHEHTIPPL
ncbi:hypothetical protein ILUMI_11179, partial [Ignelater luminosus]